MIEYELSNEEKNILNKILEEPKIVMEITNLIAVEIH